MSALDNSPQDGSLDLDFEQLTFAEEADGADIPCSLVRISLSLSGIR